MCTDSVAEHTFNTALMQTDTHCFTPLKWFHFKAYQLKFLFLSEQQKSKHRSCMDKNLNPLKRSVFLFESNTPRFRCPQRPCVGPGFFPAWLNPPKRRLPWLGRRQQWTIFEGWVRSAQLIPGADVFAAEFFWDYTETSYIGMYNKPWYVSLLRNP